MRDPEGRLENDASPQEGIRLERERRFAPRRPPAREDLVEKGDLWDWIPTLVAFLIIYAVLFVFYKPNLLFSLTTTAGGDTGAHHYPAQYLIQELLPHFRLTGWAPGWYAGMPMLTFYFPFPFLLIAIFNWFLPYTLAFKLVTVLGVFALPWTAYAFGRLFRIRRPFPVIAAVFAVVMLLMESYSIYGGNVLSTLAGEFGYMLSFSLVFLWLGTMYRGMEKPKLNMFFVLNCLILMALVLSHIVPTIVLVVVSPGLLLVNFRWRSLVYLAAVAAIGFFLSAFWSIPFAANLQWTAHMAWDQLGWEGLGGWWLAPVGVPAIVGFLFAVAKREKRLLPLLWMSLVVFILYWILPSGRLWNARVVPFWYMSIHLWAAYGISWMVRPFTVWFHDLFDAKGITARRMYTPLVALVLLVVVILTSHTAMGWIKWNYSGYEGKQNWSQYQEINNYLNTLGGGQRVMVEHNSKIDEFGTPRAFEIIPYWTNMWTMEGTLMEASYTAPFHFINQAELSKQASNAIIGVDYPTLNVANGITHMQLMNIEYFITCTEEVTADTKADGRTTLLATFGDYNIFRIAGMTGYAEVMQNQPVKIDIPQVQWRDMAVKWYEDMSVLKTPIILDNGDPALAGFASITLDQVLPADQTTSGDQAATGDEATADLPITIPQVPYTTEGHVVSEQLDNEKFTFDVDQAAVGKPVWVKVSYFPNWHVSGAKGPFLASPSFMMVIPTQTHVVMTYGRTWANTFGQTLEIIAWFILVVISAWRFMLWRRRRRLASSRRSGAIPVDEFTGQYLEGSGRSDDIQWPDADHVFLDDESETYTSGFTGEFDRSKEFTNSREFDRSGEFSRSFESDRGFDLDRSGETAPSDEEQSAVTRYESGDQGWSAPVEDQQPEELAAEEPAAEEERAPVPAEEPVVVEEPAPKRPRRKKAEPETIDEGPSGDD